MPACLFLNLSYEYYLSYLDDISLGKYKTWALNSPTLFTFDKLSNYQRRYEQTFLF